MPAPDRNQSDARSIGLFPDRYPLIVVLQGDYQLLAYRYNYEYFKHISVFFYPDFTECDSRATHETDRPEYMVANNRYTVHCMVPASERNQSDALTIGRVPDWYPLIVVQGDYQSLALRFRYT